MNVRAVAAAALAGVVAGAAAMIAGERDVADAIWATVVAVILIPETFQVLRTLRQGRVGVDAIALLAMATALNSFSMK